MPDRLEEDDAPDGFLLDGYPRTLDQVHYLDGLLAEEGSALDGVDPARRRRRTRSSARLLKRAPEQGRADDTEEAIRHRQEVYARETAPLIEVFRERGLLIEVDGLGDVDDVGDSHHRSAADRGILPTRARLRVARMPARSDGFATVDLQVGRRTSADGRARSRDRGRPGRCSRSIRPGITPLELDGIAEAAIIAAGGISNFKLVPGYRHTLCISVNADVVTASRARARSNPVTSSPSTAGRTWPAGVLAFHWVTRIQSASPTASMSTSTPVYSISSFLHRD